jgi:hypothetical protein
MLVDDNCDWKKLL